MTSVIRSFHLANISPSIKPAELGTFAVLRFNLFLRALEEVFLTLNMKVTLQRLNYL